MMMMLLWQIDKRVKDHHNNILDYPWALVTLQNEPYTRVYIHTRGLRLNKLTTPLNNRA